MVKIPELTAIAEQMAVGTLIETRTKSDILLVEKGDTEDPMAQLWRDIARKIGPIYHYRGLGTYVITKDSVGQYKLAVNSVKDTELRVLVGKELYRPLTEYIISNKRFDSEPKLMIRQYLWDDAGNMRDDLTDKTLPISMYESRSRVDLGNGHITVYVPYVAPIDNNNSEIDRLLGIVLGDRANLFRMFLAQLLFEERVNLGGRPSLILWGERNAGKGFLVESVIRSFMPQMCCPIPKDWDRFNNFQKYKFLYLDENECQDLDLKAIYVLAKRLSGGKIDMVGGKFQEKEQVKMCNYFCAISNDKPVHMNDIPASDSDNQWIAIKFPKKLDGNKDFIAFRDRHGANLEQFIKRSAGCYIKDVLLPLYIDFSARYRRTHRYGFPIPISDDLRELCEMAETMADTAFWGMLQDIEALSSSEFARLVDERRSPQTLNGHFSSYHEKGFLSSNLINFFNIIRGSQRDLTLRKAREIVMKSKILAPKSSGYMAINGTTCRGFKIDRDRYHQMMEEKMRFSRSAEEAADQMTVSDSDDSDTLPF
jgi:hypothetical protein